MPGVNVGAAVKVMFASVQVAAARLEFPARATLAPAESAIVKSTLLFAGVASVV